MRKLNYILALVLFSFLIMIHGCVTTSGNYAQNNEKLNIPEASVKEYISQSIELHKDYEKDPCTDNLVWYCVGKLFSEGYEIKHIKDGYGYVFYSVLFDNDNHFLISSEKVNGKWQVTQKPIVAGREATYLSTHKKGKKFKILQVKFDNAGKVNLKATIEE